MGGNIIRNINNLFFDNENFNDSNKNNNEINIIEENLVEINFHAKYSNFSTESEMKLIRQILKMLFNGSLKNLENSFQINNFFFSKNQKHFTSNLEILQLMDMFKFINCKKNLSEVRNKNDSIIDEDLYISFVDACVALSRLVIAKRNKISLDKLKDQIVEKFTQKLWVKKFEKESVENKLEKEKDNQLISEQIGFRIIDMTKKNLLEKLYAARERIKLKKEEEERFKKLKLKRKNDIVSGDNNSFNKFDFDINNTLLERFDSFKFTLNDKNNKSKNSEISIDAKNNNNIIESIIEDDYESNLSNSISNNNSGFVDNHIDSDDDRESTNKNGK